MIQAISWKVRLTSLEHEVTEEWMLWIGPMLHLEPLGSWRRYVQERDWEGVTTWRRQWCTPSWRTTPQSNQFGYLPLYLQTFFWGKDFGEGGVYLATEDPRRLASFNENSFLGMWWKKYWMQWYITARDDGKSRKQGIHFTGGKHIPEVVIGLQDSFRLLFF